VRWKMWIGFYSSCEASRAVKDALSRSVNFPFLVVQHVLDTDVPDTSKPFPFSYDILFSYEPYRDFILTTIWTPDITASGMGASNLD
jgi:hypothetical protein